MKIITRTASIYFTVLLSVASALTTKAQSNNVEQFNQPGYSQMALGDL